MRKACFGALAAGVAVFGLAFSLSRHARADTRVDFVRDIQPIFQQNCYKCHGSDKQKGQLRFDSRDSLFHGGQSGKALEPGNSADSRLIHRVLGLDGDDRMPLKEKPLSDQQIALLKAWIEQGAPFPESASVANAKIDRHWAYVKPVRPALPAVKDEKWCRNAIDRFILARLEKEGLAHAPQADRATLIRRVSLDLIGLPPTPSEVDAFVSDTSPNAYEKVVDRLLASPHYGERWAMPWLDLARYADSSGYERDPLRTMWPYRDWVINALNKDMPFDEFTIEQIAGDLLPNATLEQKVATGFHRNTMINREAGADQGEFFYYALVDRVNTTASVWLGTTMACSQCHNHKYDPFTQRDYYRLMAFFNGTADEAKQVGGSEIADISAKVTVEAPEVKDLRRQLAADQAKLREPTPGIAAGESDWERSLADRVDWQPVEIQEMKSAEGATLTKKPDGSILASGKLAPTDTYTIVATTPLSKITGIKLEALPDDSLPARGPGRAGSGNFALTHLSVTAQAIDGGKKAVHVALRNGSADFSQEGWPVDHAISAKPARNTGWAVFPNVGHEHSAAFETVKDIGFRDGARLTFVLEHQSEFPEHVLGRFRIWVTTTPRPVGIKPVPPSIATILDIPAERRTADQKAEVMRYYQSVAPALQPVRDEIASLQNRIKQLTATTLVMQELPTPRETHMHIRGGYLTLGEVVQPGIPAIFSSESDAPAAGDHHRPTRLDLARWLVSPENPLTARVTINRIWEQYFGVGIVKTSEDFGTQGDPPSNQELLDWLACEFQSRGWSMKQMHRLIVTSAAYQQSSDITPLAEERDPQDRLLERAPRFRLPGELIRDQALAVSGLLSEKVGGPSVFPVQPDGIWKSPYSGERWATSPGEDRYRRGLYTFLRRSSPYPAFIAFDMTTHETACLRRSRTNTPLQALEALNDAALMQPAAALARRAVKQGGSTPESRAVFIFRATLGRQPEAVEVRRLVELHEQVLKSYATDSAAARKIADSGLGQPPADMPVEDLAAWTVVSNAVLNLDETLTKG